MKTINKLIFLLLFPILSFGQITTLPHLTDFEVGFGDWDNSAFDNFDWTQTTLKTPSSGTGPQVGPPFGDLGSDGYVFTESTGTNQNSQAWLECEYDLSLYTNVQLTIAYHMYSANLGPYGPGTLQLDVYDGTTWTYGVWSNITSNIDWQSAIIDLSAYDESPEVILSWTGATTGWQSDISLDNLIVTGDEPKITAYPYEADFETEVQHSTTPATTGFTFVKPGWRNIQIGDGADWRADAGGTTSIDTGPGSGASTGASDHTPGTSTGFYLYFESSTPNYPNINSYLLTPVFDLTSNSYPIMEFWYNMYGVDMGTLKMQASTDGGNTWSLALMTITGDQGSEWTQAILDLVDYRGETNLVFRFEAESSLDWNSDICLDNFRLLDMATSPLDVYGNLTLSSDAFESSGTTVNMVGNSSQGIRSNGYAFSTINIANSNGVTLSDNLITSRLVLLSGIVSGGMVTITSTLWSAIAGGSKTSYINGTLRRYIAANTNTYAFPIGQGSDPTNYFKADFINNNLNLPGSTDFIQMSVAAESETNDNVDANLIATQGGTAIYNMFENAIWTISPSMGGIFLSGDYGLNLYTANIPGLIDNQFTILKRSTTSTNYIDWSTYDDITTISPGNGAGRMVADGYARKTGFDAFSKAGVGQSSSPLPIELIDFTAFENDGIVYIDWATVSEINNDYFTIERSKDALDFGFIDEVLGAGTSNELRTYGTLDENPYYGISYYRLKQTDFDGRFEYSDLAVVNVLRELKFTIKPNPAFDKLEMTFGSIVDGINIMTTAYHAKIKIHDVQGKLVYKKKFEGTFYKFNIDISEFNQGMYFVTFESSGNSRQTKFVKE